MPHAAYLIPYGFEILLVNKSVNFGEDSPTKWTLK